jgi:uncharacterized protein (DUF2225 family)
MNEYEWKIKIAEDVASIKTDVKHIIKNMCPLCKYPELKSDYRNMKARTSTDRRLILLIMGSFIPMVVGLFIALNK